MPIVDPTNGKLAGVVQQPAKQDNVKGPVIGIGGPPLNPTDVVGSDASHLSEYTEERAVRGMPPRVGKSKVDHCPGEPTPADRSRETANHSFKNSPRQVAAAGTQICNSDFRFGAAICLIENPLEDRPHGKPGDAIRALSDPGISFDGERPPQRLKALERLRPRVRLHW